MNADPAPRFSIVTIVFNNGDGLAQTRGSVMAQTFSDFEWIIIDGASTDGTAELALDIGLETGADVVSEPDTGIYNAMNKGLMRARGTYLVMMNAGDIFASTEVLDSVDAKLREIGDVDVLYGASLMQFPTRTIRRETRPPGYIWHGQPGLHQATFFRTTAHQKFPYDESFRITGDYDAITRMSAAGLSFASCDILMSSNSFDAKSTSNRNKVQLIREAMRCQRQNLKLGWFWTVVSLVKRAANSVVAKFLAAR